MDRYPFEDFVEKPFIYKGEKKVRGLDMDNALTCIMFIYLSSMNSQDVVNKVTYTGIWRGSVALVLVTYLFTLPTITLFLYLGKFLKHGSLSLHQCSPLLCGVGVMAFILAFPMGSMMVYYPLAENIFMKWLVDFKASLPACSILRETISLDPSVDVPCIEEKATYNCCLHHGLTHTGIEHGQCVQPRFPFYILFLSLGYKCEGIKSIFSISCNYWVIFFGISMVVMFLGINKIHKLLLFVEKFYNINIYMINLLTLLHLEVVMTGLFHYYWEFTSKEAFLNTVYDLVIMEVDHLSMSIPFLLMMGRLIDDSVPIDQLAVKLGTNKLVQVFWQVNEYIGVISVVATHYKVDYSCLQHAKYPTVISLGVVPEFLSISITRILKYPAMFSYFFSLFLKKFASLVLFGNLLSYHLYFWEKKTTKSENEDEQVRVRISNIKGKLTLVVVKVIVYILLHICHRIFNLNFSMIPAIDVAATIILVIQLCLISIFLLALYSGNRFKPDVEAVTQRKLWPEYLTHLKLQPFICIIYAVIRLNQYYESHELATEHLSEKKAEEVASSGLYLLYPVFYIIPALLISAVYIIYNFVFKFQLRVIDVSTSWGPVNKAKWKKIKPFHPGRNLVFYDKFYISHHMCFLDHVRIREVSMQQIENIKLFTRKWPCIFQTLKYKHHKKEIDDLITEAYTWGILASFENP